MTKVPSVRETFGDNNNAYAYLRAFDTTIRRVCHPVTGCEPYRVSLLPPAASCPPLVKSLIWTQCRRRPPPPGAAARERVHRHGSDGQMDGPFRPL
ncbi:hypothetical protein EVAR_38851_1 [Eumeta japonica]|uniref:Uncharacterized protein n=1 Tax=Eumeta variegata TaxID=151549 RepID=A0A4C1X6U9_EUMVA|nr:hypothetical protein EVAR_38851_1 [Eumeta japonica]